MKLEHPAWPMSGVRVNGETVVIFVKGGNDAARWLCAQLVSMIDATGAPQAGTVAVDQPERDLWVDLIARIGIAARCLYSVTPTGNEHIVKAVERLGAGLPPLDEIQGMCDLLNEVRHQFTRDDDLPDQLLTRIDAALAR